MKIEVKRDSAHAPDQLCTYEGLCRPVCSSNEETDDVVVLSTDTEPVIIYGSVEVPGAEAGRWLADNDGHGYRDGDGPVDFRRDACRTRLRHVATLAGRLKQEGMPRSEAAEELLADAREALEADKVGKAVEKAFWAGEQLVQDEVAWRLQGETELDLGINTKGLHNAREAWDEHFAGTFNYATVPLTWGVLEVEKDNPRYDVLDALVAWCKENGLRMKAHALIWHSGFEQRIWMEDTPNEEILARSAERVRTIMERIGEDLDAVELINEPEQGNKGYSLEDELQETEQAYRICKELAPHVRQMISFYGEDESWYADKCEDEQEVVTLAQFIDLCMERGIEPDLLGLQYHFPQNLFGVRQVIQYWHDRYGLPIHITELTPSSGAQPSVTIGYRPMKPPYMPTWRGQEWSEQVQADYVRTWMRFFRAMPFVENATFWATTDAPILWHDYLLGTPCELYRLPWAAGQGLLREDLTPKPALAEIKKVKNG